ncbi:MAG: hypothetical protein EPO64_00175 [Nitrospirae bacterium]|nr:MAG: hypothetical protein EPO64_00175 [Nitrospirota bacterium]
MRIEQTCWAETTGWTPAPPGRLGGTAQLTLLFGSRAILKEKPLLTEVTEAYPNAHLMGCSTAGEICGTRVLDESLIVTAVHFDDTHVKGASTTIAEKEDSFAAGERLAQSLEKDGLVHVFVLSDGLAINGSELVKGLVKGLPDGVTVTGGLSGDGERFQETLVVWDGAPQSRLIAALGLYSNRLRVGYGSLGGWDSFGPERLVTRSKGNVLYDLDGKSALALYKQYLGDHAAGLPATGLMFPLSVRIRGEATGVVRTVQSVDERQQSMTFFGDIPEGSYAQLMKTNFDRLIDGAVRAAKASSEVAGSSSTDLAVLISCVGRKLVLKQRIEEEIESIQGVLGTQTVLTGFYSYGEIAPIMSSTKCELHNQTMTITTFSER